MPPQACDACKRRKVKCDSTLPCGTCRVSKISCRYTSVPRKRGPKVARRAEGIAVSPRSTDFRHDQLGDGRSHSQSHTPTSTNGGSDYNSQGWSSPNFAPAYSPSLQPTNFTQPASLTSQLIWERLVNEINSALPSLSMIGLINSCIDLYVQYTFPIAPIIHEPSLRNFNQNIFSSQSAPAAFAANDSHERLALMKAFTELTAFCSAVCALTPPTLLPYRDVAVHPFLDASRDMLHLYQDFDLEQPDSSSLSIRAYLSTGLQNTTGKTGAAWSIHSQAAVLARRMRLYDEESVVRNDALETRLLRSRFWQLYVSDQAATLMQNRIVVLQEPLLEGELTLDSLGDQGPELLDTDNDKYQNSFEHRILSSHELLKRLWLIAAELMISMQNFACNASKYDPRVRESEKLRLTEEFLKFTSMVDELPPWLDAPNTFDFCEDRDALSYQRTAFVVQRSALILGFHCCRLVLIQQADKYRLLDIMGLYNQDLAIAMKKTEVIHDFLSEVKHTPLLCLQAQGEPMVERFRRVGSILLEIIQNIENNSIRMRSRLYLNQLLDTLSRLDSKASDELGVGL